jgi:hypothetical protein
MEMEDRFLSKKYIYPTIYSAILIVLSFFFGMTYERINGPQKVTIDSEATRNKPLYVQISNGTSTKSQTTFLDVKNELKSLQKSIKDISLYSKYVGSDSSSFNSPKMPAFILPHNVKGYRILPLIGVTQATCVPERLKKGAPIIVSFYLKDKRIITKSTPLFVRVILNKTASELVQVFERQYEIKEGQNNIIADLNLDEGKYQIYYGYYSLNELTSQYPNYYSQKCNLNIF